MIKTKKILSDLLEKEKVYRENEGEDDDDDSNRSDSSDGEESQSESNEMQKVLASLTEKASFNKSPRNHVIIVKIGICP